MSKHEDEEAKLKSNYLILKNTLIIGFTAVIAAFFAWLVTVFTELDQSTKKNSSVVEEPLVPGVEYTCLVEINDDERKRLAIACEELDAEPRSPTGDPTSSQVPTT